MHGSASLTRSHVPNHLFPSPLPATTIFLGALGGFSSNSGRPCLSLRFLRISQNAIIPTTMTSVAQTMEMPTMSRVFL